MLVLVLTLMLTLVLVVVVVLAGGIYVSSHFTGPWELSVGTDLGESWQAVVSDSTGQFVTAAVAGGGIYVSTDYGTANTALSVNSRPYYFRWWHGHLLSPCSPSLDPAAVL